MTNTQIDAKVTQLELLEGQIKELKALAESLKSDLKHELDERNVECIDTGINRVWYKLKDTCHVDTKAMKADGIYEKYAKRDCTTIFMITHVLSSD